MTDRAGDFSKEFNLQSGSRVHAKHHRRSTYKIEIWYWSRGGLRDANQRYTTTDRQNDDVLDNITLYWLTNTAISSARLYWDTRHTLPPGGGFFDVRGVKLPVAVSAFAEEIYQAPKSWAEKAYVNLIHYN